MSLIEQIKATSRSVDYETRGILADLFEEYGILPLITKELRDCHPKWYWDSWWGFWSARFATAHWATPNPLEIHDPLKVEWNEFLQVGDMDVSHHGFWECW